MSIADNYHRIQDNIAAACVRANRDPDEVTLLAVTKYVPIERMAEAIALGITKLGENRAQELTKKLEFIKKTGCDIHFIGQIQTNKIKYLVGNVHCIQSVDRIGVAEEIQRLAKQRNVVQDILIQVNIGDESQKGGTSLTELRTLAGDIGKLDNIRVKGLMCVPPICAAEEARRYFIAMRGLYEELKAERIPNVTMEHLSMGMTGDYETAIEEGSTIVRIGTGLFGNRQY